MFSFLSHGLTNWLTDRWAIPVWLTGELTDWQACQYIDHPGQQGLIQLYRWSPLEEGQSLYKVNHSYLKTSSIPPKQLKLLRDCWKSFNISNISEFRLIVCWGNILKKSRAASKLELGSCGNFRNIDSTDTLEVPHNLWLSQGDGTTVQCHPAL
jgi:hypothetical protein